MDTLSAFIRRRGVPLYFALVVLISWTGAAAVIGPANFPLTWDRFERLGAPLYAVVLAGPVLASLLLTGLLDGRAGLHALRVRLGRWRVRPRWYALALLPAALMAATLLALARCAPGMTLSLIASGHKASRILVGVAVGLVIGLGEEIGWSGFAVPRLRQRHGTLSTGVVVGLCWGAWHFPLFWQTDTFSAVGPLVLLLVRLFSWLPALRILLVWIFDRSDSLLVPALMHGCVSAVSVILTSAGPSGATLWTLTLAWPVAMWLLVGTLAVASRGRLTRKAAPGPAQQARF
jgi:membrane protease YdiL (CAAX protease family)